MEQMLDVYKRPYGPRHPVVCMDESPRQLIRETRRPLAAGPGALARHDYEYERCGVCNVFMAVEPLASKRTVQVRERRAKTDWAHFLNDIARSYSCAEKITLVMDNLNTHGPGSLYETFEPEVAKALWDRFEFVYTPKHGSRLNMAEIELNVLIKHAWTAGSTISTRSGPKWKPGRSDETTPRHKSTGSLPVPMPEPSSSVYTRLLMCDMILAALRSYLTDSS
jgi:hypothetical protein